jgi:riboflavin kinase/FMN adenylyltransferase
MQVSHGLEGLLQSPRGCVMAIGNFDGVHLGHQSIFRTAREVAECRHAPLVFVTFEPHPMTVLRPEAAPPRLTPEKLKQSLLEAQGADYLVILPPQPQVLTLSAEDFWKILHDQIGVADLVEGASFRFGRGARGTVQMLAEWVAASAVKVHVAASVLVPLLDLEVVPVSSSVIRFLLSFGRVREAAICLGRPYQLSGLVTRGYSRGKSLGFPTANLDCAAQLVPADGVYAARCRLAGQVYPVALSIGTMPTFGENARQIEAHIIGFDGDLYDQTLDVEVLNWLREQRTYSGLDALKMQIREDIRQTTASLDGDFTRPIASTLAAAGP